MKVIAQGDPVEYDVPSAGLACQLYRQDMTAALIGVVTHQTDHQRAKEAYASINKLAAAAEAAYAVIDDLVSSYNDPDDGPPPEELLNAHALLFEALGKAPAPEATDQGDDLPF